MPEIAKKRGRGRPGLFGDVPPDAVHRSIRLNQREWEAVRALIKQMRTRKKNPQKAE